MAVLAGLPNVGTLLGLLILLRGGAQTSTFLIGSALICSGLIGSKVPFPIDSNVIYFLISPIPSIIFISQSPLIFAFARRLRWECTGKDETILVILWRFCAIGLAVTQIIVWWSEIRYLPPWLPSMALYSSITFIWSSMFLAFFTLFLGFRQSHSDQHGRFGLLLVAIVLTMCKIIVAYVINLTSNDFTLVNPLAWIYHFAPLVGVGLFTYAILRHRVIDIGFAVNQTLIYGAVSFVVLSLFGLAEWGLEKLMPHEWHEHIQANAFISAGIALAIFLVFHRIRDWVEEGIEHFFFHKWKQNEEHLARLVKQADHYTAADALMAASVAEFTRFSGGANAALYMAGPDGDFVLAEGGLPGIGSSLDANLAPLVAMRADGKPLVDGDASPIPAALLLPIVLRHHLTGFFAVGTKPSGHAYRPDELEALEGAAQKIGLDLHALCIEELKTKVVELETCLRHFDQRWPQVFGQPAPQTV